MLIFKTVMESAFSNTRSNSYSIVNKWNTCDDFIKKIKGKKPQFILALGSTETSLLPGISAAGKNIQALKSTPALDAEYLIITKEEFNKDIPVSPDGIPSPVILSRPVLKLLDLKTSIIDTGTFVKPECEHISLNMGFGECISKGNSLGPIRTQFLFQKGEKLAQNLKDEPYVVLGECIPGGTTTALSLLCSLGVDAFNLVSSSDPEGNHMIKNLTVKEALLNNSEKFKDINKKPKKALESFGDPVQAFLTGFIIGAQKVELPIILAGGSQMVAIYYLAKKLLDREPYDVVVSTTSWIANDNIGNIKKLAEITDTPVIASTINFSKSNHKGLKAYEEGHIKEGVGAGGLMVTAALYKGLSNDEVIDEIEKEYETLKITV